MKITDVKTHYIRIPLKKPYHGGTYTIDSRATIIIQIITDQGIIGEAFAGDQRTNGSQICQLIHGEYKNLITNEDPTAIHKIWSRLFNVAIKATDKRTHLEALSLIDVTLWDILGKISRQPVYKLLGGHHNRIPIITIGGYYQEGKDPSLLEKEVKTYIEQEMAGIKLKVGRTDIDEDIERVKIVREAAGEDFVIAVDANMAWTPRQAIRFAKEAEKYNVAWLEEPAQWHNFAQNMHIIKQATTIPLTAGQSELTRGGCKQLMDREAIDICNADSSLCGGISEWMKIAHLAELYNVSMAHHEEWQISMHLLAGITHGTYAECFADPDRDPLFQSLVVNKRIHRGYIELPSRPGLGLELDTEFIRRHEVKT
ncbi:MAG: mandelate racemase/muconate lactonizing enzyme family protein [Candidatus Bathyarchaeia archaeon]